MGVPRHTIFILFNLISLRLLENVNNLLLKAFFLIFPADKKYLGLITTDAIAGCASIMKTDKLKKIGLSDPDFFYGEEDIDLSFSVYLRNKQNY